MATTAPGADAVTRQIQDLDRDFERHANAGDAQALTEAFYAPDAHLLPPHAPKFTGRAAISEFWKNVIAAGASDVHLNTTEVSVEGDLAYAVGGYTFTLGGATQEGKYVVVYRRQADGRYLAAVDSFSPNA